MRRATLIAMWMLAAGCGGALSHVFPRPVIPARPTAEDWPDAGAAVLEDVMTLEFEVVEADEEGRKPRVAAVLEHRRRMKILSPAGLEQARVALRADGFSQVTQIYARSVSPGGSITAMSQGAARAVPLAAGAPEVHDVLFEVPGAEVGGLVEYRYRRVFIDPAFLPMLVLGGPLPVARAELSIITHPGITLDFRCGNGSEVVPRNPLSRRSEDGRERLVFVERDLPAYYTEPDAPHPARLAPWIVVVVSDISVGELRRGMRTWTEAGDIMRPLFARVGGEPDAAGPAQGFMRVRDALTPLALPGLGVRQPRAAAALRAGDPGCSRDAAALLYQTLAGSGSKHYPAFLAAPSGPPVIDDLPGLYPFLRAVVAVDVSDQIARDTTCREDPVRRGLLCTVPPDSYAFLDPLCSGCRYGELPTELTGGRALVLIDGEARWVEVPIDPPERNRLFVQVSAELDVDGSVTGDLTGEATGAHARRLRAVLAESKLDEARDRAVLAAIAGEETPLALKEGIFSNEQNVDEPLRLRGRLRTALEKLDYEHFVLRPRDLVGAAMPGQWRSTRRHPALLEAPAWIESAAAVDLPAGFHAEVPPVVTIVEPFAEYAAGFVLRDATLTFTRRLILKQHVIPAEQWDRFRRFIDSVAEVESRGIAVQLRKL